MLSHLTASKISVLTDGPGWWHPAWAALLQKTKPKFVLLKDMYLTDPSPGQEILQQLLQAQELHALSMGVKVAYFSHLAFAQDRMHAFCVPQLPRGFLEQRTQISQCSVALAQGFANMHDASAMHDQGAPDVQSCGGGVPDGRLWTDLQDFKLACLVKMLDPARQVPVHDLMGCPCGKVVMEAISMPEAVLDTASSADASR